MRSPDRRRSHPFRAAAALVAVVLGPGLASAQTPTPRAGDLVVTGGRLWDGTGPEARANPGILIRNGTILGLGVDAVPVSGVRHLELDPGHFVMPGLIDLHAHYAVDLFGEGRIDEYTVNPVLFLANGVTATFPAGEMDPAEAERGRARVATGEIPGPRI